MSDQDLCDLLFEMLIALIYVKDSSRLKMVDNNKSCHE